MRVIVIVDLGTLRTALNDGCRNWPKVRMIRAKGP